ncbi:hypothetical protein GH714_010048 [Hevea brasiliensis]|uniref:Plastocyanin-like domain-containing protein n=1 Tax=Hevea brasiliensis TaxID=3981 RepID=A0A6A6NAE2_HEVBR|nr:hypothetical protein GH714_010048 [Hevea brasiliensis]
MGSLGSFRSCSGLFLVYIVLISSLIQASVVAAAIKGHFYKWEVEYMFWSPDGKENVVMGINGRFPGPTIRARAGDTIHIELLNKLHTEGVVIHWHGIRQTLLINGRGQYDCSLAAKYNKNLINECNIKGGEQFAPYILHVQPNKTYRIRIASTTALASLNLAIGD